ncbi:THUMP-like domain-containing protein [Planotetraspora sp. GP83]|uniref:class I SAM-dependent methyltransferase n=1 Tax=Planotetraspora sp. GP83 TaxID=3156264 RepID=UPI0035184112
MDLQAFRELLDPAGRKALAEAVELVTAGAGPVAAASALRKTHSAALTSAALTQAGLRERAKAKFGEDAAVMYFTPHGLEQATRAEVAAHRARRAREVTGSAAPRVLDVCCGIGGDLIALARAGLAVDAVDLDPLTVEVARANAAALGLSGLVDVRTADAAETDPSGYDLLFADPARRGARGRVFDPMAYSPTWPAVLDLVSRASAACLKVAPGIPYEFIPEGAEAEWVSFKGEVKEAAIWVGAGTTGRRATMLPSGTTLTPSGTGVETGPVGRYLYEPDGAAIRAHLVAEVAAMVGGRLLDPRIAYITGDRLVPTEWASCYEVTEMMPFSLKQLRATLRTRKIGNLTIKKRGSAVDIERLRKDLRLSGENSAVVVLTRIEDRPYVLLCNPPELG